MTTILVVALALVAIIAGLVIVFSPSKAYLCVTSAVLTLALLAIGTSIGSGRAIFWVAPSFLILDTALIYFVFATGLRSGEGRLLRPQTRLRISLSLSFAISLLGCALYVIWSPGFLADFNAGSPGIPLNLSLWDTNQVLIFFCFLILAPISIGSLLMVRRKD